MSAIFQTVAHCLQCGTPMEGQIIPLTYGRHTGEPLYKQAQVWCKNEKCNWFLVEDYNQWTDEQIVEEWNTIVEVES